MLIELDKTLVRVDKTTSSKPGVKPKSSVNLRPQMAKFLLNCQNHFEFKVLATS